MILSELIKAIVEIVQDPSFTDEQITDYLNEAVLSIASGVEVATHNGLTDPLPDLLTNQDLTLDNITRSVPVPLDYQRGLFNVHSATGTIPILKSLKAFMSKYPRFETGDNVDHCCLYGSKFFYHPAANKVVNISYYRKPEPMESDDDEPDGIPEHLHKPLLVGYVCKEIFSLIEDGIDGKKQNTAYYDNMYQRGVIALDKLLGHDGLPEFIDDAEGFIQ